MQWTGLNELREMFLSFFESKGHLRLPGFSLIPQGDKSLLLINSGMAPMKKYFTGEVTPPRKRVTTCQKCIRTPDIERVGKTSRHGTYFEMLGNFSFGDYFKEEAIPWAWEFLTGTVKMDPDKLHVSVYLDDDEAYDIWTQKIGVKPDHMIRLGKEDNFWEHGPGPCGPCSEIYYDRGEAYGCGKPDCAPGCDCDRYVEIWNVVFSQFVNDGNGNYERMDHPNIDTGMGLERLACMVQGVDNLFEVDTVQKIMQRICETAGKKYHDNEKDDVALRVITDHIRSTTMMISDGVMPSNEGRGYVMRRLLRRAVRYGRLLGIEGAFMADVAETVIEQNEGAYPNLRDRHDMIIKVISVEEENFNRTLDGGLVLLSEMADAAGGDTLSGEDAFKLSDTFGFPIDLTEELLADRGMKVDRDRYQELVKIQRETARASRKKDDIDAWKNAAAGLEGVAATRFTGYDAFDGEASVEAIIADGERAEELTEGKAILILDVTPFYAEGGGQVGDSGVIRSSGFEFRVDDTKKTESGVYLHEGELISGVINEGNVCTAAVDTGRRLAIMRNHTAAHLLQAALRRILGTHVEQAGQLVNEDAVRFDFTHFSALSADEISAIEREVNEQILSAVPVTTEVLPIEEARKSGAMALFGEKYGDFVRVVSAGAYSKEFCGGTHAKNTGSLGLFKIASESSVASGVRRIEGVTGYNVMRYIADQQSLIYDSCAALKVGNPAALPERAANAAGRIKALEKELESLKSQIASKAAGDLLSGMQTVGSVRFLACDLGEKTPDELRSMIDGVKSDDTVVIFAGKNAEKGSVNLACSCGAAAIAAGADAGRIVRAAAQAAGGNGGGKKDMAMAGAKDASKVAEALAAAKTALEQLLG